MFMFGFKYLFHLIFRRWVLFRINNILTQENVIAPYFIQQDIHKLSVLRVKIHSALRSVSPRLCPLICRENSTL
jgi:hypothetical protein